MSLRAMVKADLPCVLAWRNHLEVRRFMQTSHEISPDEHSRWFERASLDPHRHLLIFEHDGQPSGFMNLCEVAPGRVFDWGFYVTPGAPRGCGTRLGNAALNYAFAQLGAHKLCGQVLGFNERSVRLHQRLGFREEGRLRSQHFDGNHYHDIHCFGLLVHEWRALASHEGAAT